MLDYRLIGKFLLIGAVVPLAATPGRAQTAAPADSVALAATVGQLHTRYLRAQGPEVALNNGVAYATFLPAGVAGHPFMGSSKERPGSVQYDGYYYQNLQLQYDTRQDQLVLAGETPIRIRLVEEKVGFFTLDDQKFVRLRAAAGLPAGGYYQQLFASRRGPLQLLARHTKTLERKGGAEFKQEIHETTKYFLQTEQGYFPVSSAGTVLRVLPAQKKELKEFIRSRKLKFGKAEREASLTALITYSDTLTPSSR